MKTGALIPAFCEERYIAEVVAGVKEFLPDVLVVDDASEDATPERAQAAGAVVVRHERNLGKGAALLSGFHYFTDRTDVDAVLCLDADGQHAPEDIPAFLTAAEATPGPGMVIGTRMARPGDMPRLRYWTNRVTSGIVSAVAKAGVTDSQCGFRLLRTDVIRALNITTCRYDMESEMIIQAARKGFALPKSRYGPYTVTKRAASTP